WKLSARERGVLMNYVGICQFQVFFELGVGIVLQQMASRERAFLTLTPDGTLTGGPLAKARLASLLRLAVRWFLAVAVLINVVLLPAGWALFSSDPLLADVDWQLGWVLTVLFSSAL